MKRVAHVPKRETDRDTHTHIHTERMKKGRQFAPGGLRWRERERERESECVRSGVHACGSEQCLSKKKVGKGSVAFLRDTL